MSEFSSRHQCVNAQDCAVLRLLHVILTWTCDERPRNTHKKHNICFPGRWAPWRRRQTWPCWFRGDKKFCPIEYISGVFWSPLIKNSTSSCFFILSYFLWLSMSRPLLTGLPLTNKHVLVSSDIMITCCNGLLHILFEYHPHNRHNVQHRRTLKCWF